MKRVLFQAALCAVVSCGSCAAAETCTSCKGTDAFKGQFEQMLKNQRKVDTLKTSYKNLVNRVMATVEDKEVVAARGELYKATKKVATAVQKKFVITSEEISQVQRLGEALSKQRNCTQALTEEEESIVQAFQLLIIELTQEYPMERLKSMVEREEALFNQN